MRFIVLSAWLLFISATLVAASDDLVIADFEAETYGEWKATGEAFGPGPARGTLPGQMHVEGFKGTGLVNSFFRGDQTTGTLTSPEFKVERKFLSFLIGGGQHAEQLSLKLLIDGKAVRNATGPNDKAGGTEALAPEAWDVTEFAGKIAVIQIVDQATGGWGHINVDHLVQTDRKPVLLLTNAKREFQIEQRYLNLPIKNGAPQRKVTMLVDGRVEVTNDIELAHDTPDWWAFIDVSAWRGKTVTIQIDKLPDDSSALSAIEPSDSIRDADQLYREPLRPQLHFSSKRGWLNDPNGMVFFNGEYHLFYQHNPYGWSWGNMHWGHAVSRDMVHWQELGDKLRPDEFGPMFSGSAVVDWKNTSGFGTEGQPPLVLIYTAAGNPTVQCLASSTDGRRFTKYGGNPVLKQITGGNRDPKVIWHQPTQKWVMVLYVELPGKKHTVHFYNSPNLRDWTLTSITEGGIDNDKFLFECPDFFELPVDGDAAKQKWVLTAANSEYAVGTFDGAKFTAETKKLPGVRGRGFYAAQTFSDIPQSDGRRIQIGWCQAPSPGMPFNQSQSLPSELTLRSTPAGVRLHRQPVKELASLRDGPNQADSLANFRAELIELRADFTPGDAESIEFTLRGAKIVYDAKQQELIVNDHRAPAPLIDGQQRLIVFVDRTMLEVFASNGQTYIPLPFIPQPEDQSVSVSDRKKVTSLQVFQLKSLWEPSAK